MKIPKEIKHRAMAVLVTAILLVTTIRASARQPIQNETDIKVTTAYGELEGRTLKSGINVFMGIPYAAAPVGELRWKAPQPFPKWNGIRKATSFGPRPIQKSGILYEFRSEEMSEDCLYLNIWTPSKSFNEQMPVYVFVHGGSFIHGDGSQVAYDGESMAKQGIVYVSINYRLGVFGFLAHPELSQENGKGSSGNYGLLDQLAALKWVQKNIAAFGGDPKQVTLGGESVGAQSVSAHMASPLSQGLFSRAIAQSSSLLDSRKLIKTKEAAEKMGVEFVNFTKSKSITEMRKLSANRLLKLASKGDPRRFKPTVDGCFLEEFPIDIFETGRQASVPLLVGWNANEVPSLAFYRLKRATPENFRKKVERIYGSGAHELLAYYPVKTRQDAREAGAKLGSDWLINFGTWRLAELHASKQPAPVYRYLFDQPHPGLTKRVLNSGSLPQQLLKRILNKTITGSAFHAAEIEYALGNLDVQKNYAWKKDDYSVSSKMQGYFSNFIKSGNPNGMDIDHKRLIKWPVQNEGNSRKYMRLGIEETVEVESDTNRKRLLLLQKIGTAE